MYVANAQHARSNLRAHRRDMTFVVPLNKRRLFARVRCRSGRKRADPLLVRSSRCRLGKRFGVYSIIRNRAPMAKGQRPVTGSGAGATVEGAFSKSEMRERANAMVIEDNGDGFWHRHRHQRE